MLFSRMRCFFKIFFFGVLALQKQSGFAAVEPFLSPATLYQEFEKRVADEKKDMVLKLNFQLLSATEENDKIKSYLSLLAFLLKNDFKIDIHSSVFNMPIDESKVSSELWPIYLYLRAQVFFKRGDFISSILTLEPVSLKKDLQIFSLIFPIYIESLLNVNLNQQAYDFYKNYAKAVQKKLSIEYLNKLKVSLAGALKSLGEYGEAVKLLEDVLEYYPISPVSSQAFALLTEIECLDSVSTYRYSSTASLAKRWEKHVGVRSDIKNLILAQNGIYFDKIRETIKKPVSAFEEQVKLLKQAELLLSFREYKASFEILNYLDSLKIQEPAFPTDVLLESLGKVYNAMQNPQKAAESYKRFFHLFPNSPKVKTIIERIGKSLHFEKKFVDAAKFLETKKVVEANFKDNWFVFWNYYLSKNYKTAQQFAEKVLLSLKDTHPDYRKYHYWLSRIYMKTNQIKKAHASEQLLLLDENARDIYSIFVEQRKLKAKVDVPIHPKIPKNSIIFPVNVEENERNKFILELLEYGLADFASLYIKPLLSEKLTKEEALEIGEIANKNGDFYDAILISNNFINQKNIKRDSPLYENMLRLVHPLAYWDDVQFISSKLQIDPFWILSIMKTESLFNENAQSPVGAVGLMQLMPYTGFKIAEHLKVKNFHPEDLRDPSLSVVMGGWYLAHLAKIYRGDLLLATASYNAGPNAVNRWISQNPGLTEDEFYENIPYVETKKYVSKVLSVLDIYHQIQLGNDVSLNLLFFDRLPKPNLSLEIF